MTFDKKLILYTLSILFFFAFTFLVSAQTTYVNDTNNSHAYYKGTRGVAYTFGRFDDFEMTVTYDENDLGLSKVQANIFVESVSTKNAKRDDHLRSSDFFDATQFPTIDFVSTTVEAVTSSDDEYFLVTGDFFMHGITKEITVKVEKTGRGEKDDGTKIIGFYTEFEIDRTEFGMNFMSDSISPIMTVMLSFDGVAK